MPNAIIDNIGTREIFLVLDTDDEDSNELFWESNKGALVGGELVEKCTGVGLM